MQDSLVTRRDTILAAAAGSLFLAGSKAALAAEGSGHDGHEGHTGHGAGTALRHQALFDKAMKCVAQGEICVPHCIMLIGKGDTSLAKCLASVQAMLPACGALARFAALEAPRLKELAEFCIGVCEDCEKECRKHESHAVCRACAESCADCAKECKALIKA